MIAVQTAKKICAVYRDDAIAEATIHKRFVQFRNKNLDQGKDIPGHKTRGIAKILHIWPL